MFIVWTLLSPFSDCQGHLLNFLLEIQIVYISESWAGVLMI
jgi:hypothetical protein